MPTRTRRRAQRQRRCGTSGSWGSRRHWPLGISRCMANGRSWSTGGGPSRQGHARRRLTVDSKPSSCGFDRWRRRAGRSRTYQRDERAPSPGLSCCRGGRRAWHRSHRPKRGSHYCPLRRHHHRPSITYSHPRPTQPGQTRPTSHGRPTRREGLTRLRAGRRPPMSSRGGELVRPKRQGWSSHTTCGSASLSRRSRGKHGTRRRKRWSLWPCGSLTRSSGRTGCLGPSESWRCTRDRFSRRLRRYRGRRRHRPSWFRRTPRATCRYPGASRREPRGDVLDSDSRSCSRSCHSSGLLRSTPAARHALVHLPHHRHDPAATATPCFEGRKPRKGPIAITRRARRGGHA